MRRCLAVAAIALISLSLKVQGQTLPGAPVRPNVPRTGYPPPARPGGVIIGTVVDAVTGLPVPRAVVRLSNGGSTQTRVADDKGRFYFVDVPEAQLDLVATKIGFYDGAYGKERAGGTGVPLSMSSSRWISDVRIALFKSAAISGIVSDDGGEPLPGVRVRAWRRDFVEGREQYVPAGEARTSDDGSYRVFDLRPGSYVMSVPSVQVTLPIDEVDRAFASGTPTAAHCSTCSRRRRSRIDSCSPTANTCSPSDVRQRRRPPIAPKRWRFRPSSIRGTIDCCKPSQSSWDRARTAPAWTSNCGSCRRTACPARSSDLMARCPINWCGSSPTASTIKVLVTRRR
jgi:hypothetical protein